MSRLSFSRLKVVVLGLALVSDIGLWFFPASVNAEARHALAIGLLAAMGSGHPARSGGDVLVVLFLSPSGSERSDHIGDFVAHRHPVCAGTRLEPADDRPDALICFGSRLRRTKWIQPPARILPRLQAQNGGPVAGRADSARGAWRTLYYRSGQNPAAAHPQEILSSRGTPNLET